MKIQWTGTMQGAGCIKFDDDGSSVVKFTQDGQQLPQVVRLTMFQGKAIKITVEEA